MELLKQMFSAWAGEPCVQCLALSGGGSARSYYRLVGATRCCIGTIAHDLRENEAFFAFTSHLFATGLPVPELYAIADDRQHYLQQDLGDASLYILLHDKKRQGGGFDAEMLALYKQALADLHALQVAGLQMDFAKAYPRSDFDQRSMMWDFNYFKYNFLKLAHIPFDEDQLEEDFLHLTDFLLSANQHYFMYRDFQGRNILLAPQHGAHCSHPLYYIDYQGGRRGAAQYDVASLLYSAKSDLPEAIRTDLLQHYVRLHGDPHFMEHFWGYVWLRILQTLGAYGYRGLFERKPYFLDSIPLALRNMRRIADEHPLSIATPELLKVLAVAERQYPMVANSAIPSSRLTVSVISFSYKQGLPSDPSGNGGGHVFDCRALPNPGRYPQYRSYTGRDIPVVEFLQKEPSVDDFLSHTRAIVEQSVTKYIERHFTHLSVAFGCTGGQHRSVYCAEQTASWLRQAFPEVDVVVCHREHPE